MEVIDIASLAERARKGDEDAFGELVMQFTGAVRSLCILRAADPVRADDIAQQVFLTAWEKIPELPPGVPFWPWLERITRNHLMNDWRRVQRERGLKQRYTVAWLATHETENDKVAEAEVLVAQLQGLRHCLEQVPKNLKQMVRMRYEEDFSSDEIAESMGLTAENVRQILLRLREKLRDCVERHLEGKGAL